jgi:pimeloyl-ACP methyl ester carboxylesterase
MAQDVHALMASLGLRRSAVVGHDIGLMVAYAYAAQFPAEVDRIVLMDAFLPGIGNWKDVWLLRDLWHFHFYGKTPLALVAGRERIYFEHFWNDFAADPKRSIPEADRRFYAKAYAQPGAMQAGFRGCSGAFEPGSADLTFAKLREDRRLPMPNARADRREGPPEKVADSRRPDSSRRTSKGVVVKGSGSLA